MEENSNILPSLEQQINPDYDVSKNIQIESPQNPENTEKNVEENFEPLQTMEGMLQTDIKFEKSSADFSFVEKSNDPIDSDYIIYCLKDLLMMFVLLLTSGINFNYFSLIYVCLGFLYYSVILKNDRENRDFKLCIEIIILIYSIILVIFKIGSIFFLNEESEFTQNHKNLLINFGLAFLISTGNKKFLITTFIAESVVCIFSIIAIIISKICVITNRQVHQVQNMKMTYEKLFSMMIKCLFFSYIALIGFGLFNRSLLSLLYLIPMNFIIFLYGIDTDKKKLYNFFRIISRILLIFIIIHIIFINVSNIYSIAFVYFEKDKGYSFLSLWYKLGFYFFYNSNEKVFWNNFFGYLFGCLSIVILSLAIKLNNSQRFLLAFDENMQEEKEKTNKTENCINILFKNLFEFFFSPNVIIHICRIMGIIWLYIFRNFYSFGVFIWLFFSFFNYHISSNKFWTLFILIPIINISLFCYHVSSIDGLFENSDEITLNKYYRFCLGKFPYDHLRYIFANLFYIFTIWFLNSLYDLGRKIIDKKNENNKKTDNEMQEMECKEEENLDNIKEDENNQISENKNDNNIIISDFENQKYSINDVSMDINTSNIQDKSQEGLLTKQSEFIKNKKETKEKYDFESPLSEEQLNQIILYNIIMKNLFSNIDKISLLAMYFVSFNTVNIIHFIFVVIFLIQLISPAFIQKTCFYIIQIFQFLFLIEYIIDILKIYFLENFKENKEKLQFFVGYDVEASSTSIEILIFFIIYCFYIQYLLSRQELYQKLTKSEHINLTNYIKKNFKNYPLIQNILFFIGQVIAGIYIWVLIALFIFFTCYFEINLLFGIKLCLFLITVFSFMTFIQEPFSKKINITIGNIMLIFSGINTVTVYAYQLLNLEYLNGETDTNDNTNKDKSFFVMNLPNIGFTAYEQNQLYVKLLPHFISNFLGLLFIREVKRIENVIDKEKAINENEKKDEKNNNNINLDEISNYNEKYYSNKSKINILNFKNFIFTLILSITTSYWLFIFLTVCIIFTQINLSIVIFIYIIIFLISFISMFGNIINNLAKFMNKESYFISKVIRYSIVERKYHLNQNKINRTNSFRYLFGFNCLFICLYYFTGVIDLFENGCNNTIWNGCDNSHSSIFIDKRKKDAYLSLIYLFGLYADLQKNGIITIIWVHLLIFGLISFDVYIQKLESYFLKLSVKNRKEHSLLVNENVILKPFVKDDGLKSTIIKKFGKLLNLKSKSKSTAVFKKREINIDDNITNTIKEEKEDEKYEIQKNNKENLLGYDELFDGIKQSLDNRKIRISSKDEELGKKYLMRFLEAFKDIKSKNIELQKTNEKYKIIQVLKNICEEIIIFVLLSAAISKLNIWSFIYMIVALYFILSKKSMKKYYHLFCFIIFSIILQSLIFISNLKEETDPSKNKEMLVIIKNTLDIPWYDKFTDDENGFFFGLGVNSMQINIIWIDFVEIILIYIYLDYFSYSIYQDVPSKGQNRIGNNKINYFNLHLNTKVVSAAKILTKKQFQKYYDCMKFNFDLDLGEYEDFKNKIITNKKDDSIEFREIKKSISTEINTDTRKENTKKVIKDKKTCFGRVKDIIYLSSHNVILIIVMIISMMVSGLLSIFYVVFSLHFLVRSNAMYTGKKYNYPNGIKKILRIAILIDILIQTLYQTPYLNPDSEDNTFVEILKIIGFNKIINFGKTTITETGEIVETMAKDFKVYPEQMILVIGKALTYFFISLQILIYKSQDFQEYYLTYLLTKNLDLRKRALMQVFKFNNKRVEVMDRSISLRHEMTKTMNKLQKVLNKWIEKLGGYIGEGAGFFTKIEEDNKLKPQAPKQTISTEKENEEQKSNKVNTGSIFQAMGIFVDKNTQQVKTFVPKTKVINVIKKWIFGGNLIKFFLWLHKYVASYNTIDELEKDEYEKEIIQGKTITSSFIERYVDNELNKMDLDHFTNEELNEVEKYFNGTREKLLKKLKKENLKKQKLIRKGKTIKFDDKADNIKKSETMNENNIKDFSLNLNNDDPKFLQLEQFTSSKIFTKYIKTTYILQCIFNDCISFCETNFHWVCYIMMLIDHMLSSSALSLFFPISIFCYALLEYPRPKSTYWTICIVYTVVLITVKFIIQLQLFVIIFQDKNDKNANNTIKNPYQDFIDNLDHYKLGLSFSDTTFCLSFFNYIVYDGLVIGVLLINNYLLIRNGLWKKREQQIETIYQAMERIAATRHLEINDPEEIKKFNEKVFIHIINKRSSIKISKLEDGKISVISKNIKNNKGEENTNNNQKEEEKNINANIDNIENENNNDANINININNNKEEKNNNTSDNNNITENVNIENEKKNEQITEEKGSHIKSIMEDRDNKNKYNEENRTYYQGLFPRIRNEKPGHEYYASYTVSMLFIMIFIILFYTNMNQDKTFNNVSYDINQFSGSMVVFLIIHVIFLVYDRVILLLQNRNNLTYDYIIYDRKTLSPISQREFNIMKGDITREYQDTKRQKFFIPADYIEKYKDQYNFIYIQSEEFNSPLLQKYILHIVITIFSHVFIFFYLPMQGNYNIRNAIYCIDDDEGCNDFLENPLLVIFYILYIIYLISSALQVKYGFYDMKRKSMLKSGTKNYNGWIFNIYKNIPFLYEIKLAIDWTFTNTCLSLFQWNKFESVYDTIYLTYIQMIAKNSQYVGQEVGKVLKYGMGATLSFALVLLLVVPLMLFSSLNPTNEYNNVTAAKLKVDLSFFYENGAIKNYTLFENSKPETIKTISDDESDESYKNDTEEWKNYGYSTSVETKNFPKSQVQKVKFFSSSDRNWGLAKPHIKSLIKVLDSLNETDTTDVQEIDLVLDYEFERPLPAEAQTAKDRIGTVIFYKYDQYYFDNIYKLESIKNALLYCNDNSVIFNNIYSAPLRLTANVKPKIIEDMIYIKSYDVKLGYTGCKIEKNNNENETIYLESYFTFEKIDDNNQTEGITFHLFSDKVSKSTSGYSVLTFYVSFILLCGTYGRNFFSGEPQKIKLTELPHPEDIIDLCEGINVARYSFDYEQEEKLYYILIEIMRSPDYLRSMTGSSTSQFNKRQEITRIALSEKID